MAPAHAAISHTLIPWNHGCVTSITHVTHCTTPLEQAECSLSITHIFLITLGGLLTQGTACVYSLTSLHSHSTSTTLLCFIFAFVPIPFTLPSSASPTCPTLSASTSQALSVTRASSPFLLPPPSSLPFKLAKAHVPGGKTVF